MHDRTRGAHRAPASCSLPNAYGGRNELVEVEPATEEVEQPVVTSAQVSDVRILAGKWSGSFVASGAVDAWAPVSFLSFSWTNVD